MRRAAPKAMPFADFGSRSFFSRLAADIRDNHRIALSRLTSKSVGLAGLGRLAFGSVRRPAVETAGSPILQRWGSTARAVLLG